MLEIIENDVKSKDNKRPSILFVHGMWHGAWCWEPYFLPYFEKLGYKVYALSLSNHGKSSKRKTFNLLRINDYVKDLKDTIESFDETPILVGHSMGGFIVQKYLENNDVPGAALITPVPPFGIWGGTIAVLKIFPLAFLKANLTLNLKYIINSSKKYKYLLGSDNFKDTDIDEYVKKLDNESFLAYLDMLGLNLVNTKKINTPLLIIGGGLDRVISEKVVRKTGKIYGITPIIFDDMGHNMMLESEYKKVAKKIIKFIENVSK